MTNISTGIIIEALNNKCNRDLKNTRFGPVADVVIEYQNPSAENNYTWYRKYASGWVEQGGYIASTTSTSTIVSVALLVKMADTNYHIQKTTSGGAVGNSGLGWNWMSDFPATEMSNKTTTMVNIGIPGNAYVLGVYWEVKGMAAI